MIKTIALVVICICSVWVGAGINGYLRKRSELYRELVDLTEKVRSEISFKKTYLQDILKKLNLSREISDIFEKNEGNSPFCEEERMEIEEFFTELGSSDVEGEMSKLADAKSRFEARYEKAKHSYEKNGKLALKLSALFGIMILILFI